MTAACQLRVAQLLSIGNEWFETYGSYNWLPSAHPPSLKNPLHVKVDWPQDGWHKGDSEAKKKQARLDMIEIHKRLRRQIGKPEVSQVAIYPLFPDLHRWL